MIQKPVISPLFLKRKPLFVAQDAPAWLLILGLVLFTSLCILAGSTSSVLRSVFPLAAGAVGVILYWKYPILYVGFTWWIWILTPFIARLVDYKTGVWDQQRVMLVAPYLVTLITFFTFLKHLPRSNRIGGLPFVLAITGVFYALMVGMAKNPPFSVARSLLDWLTPITFAYHLLVHWRDYPIYRRNFQQVFFWGVLVTGIYGIYQYIVAPEWDCFWLVESTMSSSAGSPEPLGMRVWSTMHSPGPFGVFMMAGLLLLFSNREILGFGANCVGYLSFLLSLVRSAWGGWLIGLIVLISSLKARLQMRLIMTVLVIALSVVPLTTMEPFSKVISSRFESLTNLKKDQSYNDRTENFNKKVGIAFTNGLGNGLGTIWTINEEGKLEQIVLDNGILDIFFTLGWFGAVFYVGGLGLILYKIIKLSEASFDTFLSAARAISIASYAQIIFSSTILGFSGLLIWAFLGISIAANKYYQHQNAIRINRELEFRIQESGVRSQN